MKSIFLEDVFEQPKAIRNLLSQKKDLEKKATQLKHERILFLGMGASYYASLYATIYLRSFGIDAQCRELSEFIWYDNEKLLKQCDTVFLVSQSGETAELTRFIDIFSDELRNCVLITNNPQSFNAKIFGESKVFPIFAGTERAMGSSKTFVNTILTLLLIGSTWIGAELDLEKLVDHIENVLSVNVDSLAQALSEKANPILVGRGFALPILRMAQLTLAEIAKTNCVVYSGAGFRHGPMELMVTNPLICLVALQGKTLNLTLDLLADLSSYKDVWCITDQGIPNEKSILIKEGLDEVLSSIPVIVIFQKIANSLAIAKGYEPGIGIIASKVTKKE